MTSNTLSSRGKRRKSMRLKKKRDFFHEQVFKTNKKKKVNLTKEINLMKEEIIFTKEEIRDNHVNKLTNIFRDYIKSKLEEIDLDLEREKSRVTSLVKNFKKSLSMKDKVYASNAINGYLVTSSQGTETYTVKQKAIADNVKYVCNCGNKYKDNDRTSCKHCGAVMFYNFNNFMNDYLTKEPSPYDINLKMYHMEKKFYKFNIKDFLI